MADKCRPQITLCMLIFVHFNPYPPLSPEDGLASSIGARTSCHAHHVRPNATSGLNWLILDCTTICIALPPSAVRLEFSRKVDCSHLQLEHLQLYVWILACMRGSSLVAARTISYYWIALDSIGYHWTCCCWLPLDSIGYY